MAELKTPVKLVEYEPNDAPGRKAYALADDGGAWLCTFHRVQREGAEAIKDAVNRDAEHAETVRTLTEQRDALLAVCRTAAYECLHCGSTNLLPDCDPECSTLWCDDCGSPSDFAPRARAAIAAAEGGGT